MLRRILMQIPLVVRLKDRIDRKLGVSWRVRAFANSHLEHVDRKLIIDKMMKYWTHDLGTTEATAREWLSAALDFGRNKADRENIEARLGPLRGKRVADIGCGWGTLLLLLDQVGAVVSACDRAPIHVEVAKLRVPKAEVVQADARDLSVYPDESFDFVIEHDVFEHIGDYTGDTGPMGRTREDKLQNLKELRRIMKKGGRGFLSTGNYSFPFNGEVHLWAVHWFPYEYQQRYLRSLGLNSDRYWLCTWPQLGELFQEAKLCIDEIFTPPEDVKAFQARFGALFAREPTANATFDAILGELMLKNPAFMPSWRIFYSRAE
jgi:ubiquinone/menaquinone biosynthesis C-methylase UbiE